MGDIPEIWCQTQQPSSFLGPYLKNASPTPWDLHYTQKMEPYSFQSIMQAGATLVSPGSVKDYCYQEEG